MRVAVHDLGGDGLPVLAAHATGFHGRVWTPVAQGLADHHVIGPDFRGHGCTELPAGVPVDWDGFARDVLAVVDALGLVRPLGIGHSKGGAALLRAEVHRPGTFRAIWCFEPIVFPTALVAGREEANPLAEGALRRRTTFGSYEAAIANFAAKPPLSALRADVLSAYVYGGFRPLDDGSVTLRCRPEIEAEVYRMGTAHDTFDHLGTLRCPVAVAMGATTPMSPAALAHLVADAVPGAVVHEFPALGHFGPLEDPTTVAADIAAFSADTR